MHENSAAQNSDSDLFIPEGFCLPEWPRWSVSTANTSMQFPGKQLMVLNKAQSKQILQEIHSHHTQL